MTIVSWAPTAIISVAPDAAFSSSSRQRTSAAGHERNEVNHLAVLLLLSGADYLKAFQMDQLQAQVMFFLDLHAQGMGVTQVFWALWLLPLGYLVFKSGFLPRILGVLLVIACFGYLIDSFAFFLFPKFEVTIVWFTFLGEVLFPLWLLVKGVNVEQWEKRALGSS